MTLKKNLPTLVLSFIGLLFPASLHAQFVGYTSPQTVNQSIAANIACSPTIAVIVSNLGQTIHSLTFTVTGSEPVFAFIQGSNDGVTFFQISDKAATGTTASVTASGYYPVVKVQIACSLAATRVTANYTGTSVTLGPTFGDIDASYYTKSIVIGNQSAGANFTSPLVTTPYGSMSGYVVFNYSGGAGPVGSTLSVQCATASVASIPNFPLATPTTLQVFPLPDFPCENAAIAYNSGGASANTIVISYLFLKPGGKFPTTSGPSLAAPYNLGAVLTEKGARWSVVSNPAVGNIASAVKAAGAGSVRHVADCITVSAGAAVAPVATTLTINLIDGSTTIWSTNISVPATTGQHGGVSFCGLNLTGSPAAGMTLQFSSSLVNESEAVTLTGYDVQ